MINVIFFTILLAHANCCIGQKTQGVTQDSSFNELDAVSYFWNLDSLGLNGYRLSNYKTLLVADFKKLTKDELISKLGKPNFVTENNRSTNYCYYFFDGRKIPVSKGYSEELLYIFFSFRNENPYLESAGINAVDY